MCTVCCYQAKALVTDSTLLAGLLIVVVFVVTKVYAAACLLVTKPRPTKHTPQSVIIRAYSNN